MPKKWSTLLTRNDSKKIWNGKVDYDPIADRNFPISADLATQVLTKGDKHDPRATNMTQLTLVVSQTVNITKYLIVILRSMKLTTLLGYLRRRVPVMGGAHK